MTGTSTIATNKTTKKVMFTSPSKYQTAVWWLVAIPLLAILIAIISLRPRRDYTRSSTAWILGWMFLLVIVLYMAVLPKQVDVRSNGTVAVKTFLLTFHIDGIVRAYQGGSWKSEDYFLRRKTIRFNTTFDEPVVIRRSHGKWDVIVTPEDPAGFINAVEQMVRENGIVDDEEDDEDVENNNNNNNNRGEGTTSTNDKTDFVIV
jgi:hypothetical protein